MAPAERAPTIIVSVPHSSPKGGLEQNSDVNYAKRRAPGRLVVDRPCSLARDAKAAGGPDSGRHSAERSAREGLGREVPPSVEAPA